MMIVVFSIGDYCDHLVLDAIATNVKGSMTI